MVTQKFALWKSSEVSLGTKWVLRVEQIIIIIIIVITHFLYGLVVRLNSLHSKRYLLTNQSCICTMIDYDFGISLIK